MQMMDKNNCICFIIIMYSPHSWLNTDEDDDDGGGRRVSLTQSDAVLSSGRAAWLL